jgi:hypothetical protein
MKDRDASRHPGPWRVMRVDSEFAGLLVAVGFLVMGFVSMPIATWFILGAVALGVFVALVLRFTPKKYSRVVVGTVVILATVVLFWEGREPRRPGTVSSGAFYVLAENARFRLHNRGYWLDCWFDKQANVDQCKLTDEKGTELFEDVYLPCVGNAPLRQSVLVEDGRGQWGGEIWKGSADKGIQIPVVYVHGNALLPRRFFAEAKRDIYCPAL